MYLPIHSKADGAALHTSVDPAEVSAGKNCHPQPAGQSIPEVGHLEE